MGGYSLGIDLGTSYTAAAIVEAGQAEIVPLGDRGPSIPSVVYVRPDGRVVAGSSANRHALTSPDRIARELKRRLGDPTPILVAGFPTAAEVLTGRLLRWVYDAVVRSKGGRPEHVALTHPANWGPYRREVLRKAAEAVGLGGLTLVSEPEAAVTWCSSSQEQPQLPAGATVAVYDLGGGTLDAVVLRVGEDGAVSVLGTPDGVERLGGIDFDTVVLNQVRKSLEGELDDLDEDDVAVAGAVARLRQECTLAKETLSLEDAAIIPVVLPDVDTEVRLTRPDLEDELRADLQQTVAALERALRSARVAPDELDHLLVLGGSSRIPLVPELLSETLGRPVEIYPRPKDAVALGAAIVASRAPRAEPETAPEPVEPEPGVPQVTATPEAPPDYPTPQVRDLLARRQRMRNRWSVLVGALVLLAAIAATFVITRKGDGDLSLDELEVGECFRGRDLDALETVPCDRPHDGELFAVVPPSDTADPEDQCRVHLVDYYGAGQVVANSNGIDVGVVPGDHTRCVAVAVGDHGTLDHPVRAAAS